MVWRRRTCCTSTSTSRAASARRAARAATGCYKLLAAHRDAAKGRCATSICSSSVANNIVGKTLCAFGDAAATPVLTTVKHFRAEFEAHVREGRCTLPADWRARAGAAWGRTDGSVWTARLDAVSSRSSALIVVIFTCSCCCRPPFMVWMERKVVRASSSSASARTASARTGCCSRSPTSSSCSSRRSCGRRRPTRSSSPSRRSSRPPPRSRRSAVVPFGAADRRSSACSPQPLPLQRRRRQRRRAGGLRDHVDGRLRHRARRLELEQQVLAARRPALVGADDQLRAVVRPGARGRASCWPARCRCARSSTRSRATGSASSRAGSSSCSRSASSST